jgi:hypothetical protein
MRGLITLDSCGKKKHDPLGDFSHGLYTGTVLSYLAVQKTRSESPFLFP